MSRPAAAHPASRAVVLGAVTLVAGVALAAGALPQVAAASTSPVVPGASGLTYSNSKECVDKLPIPTTVQNGVSTAQRTLQFTQAWKFSQGDGVKVGVIDTGVNPVAAFDDNRLHGVADLIQPKDPVSSQPGLDDCDGHGTLVAGLIAAAPDLTSGFSGVAPKAQIFSIRQTSSNYSYKNRNGDEKDAGSTADLAAAINYLVDRVGVGVINMSVAQCGPAGTVDDPLLTAAVAHAVASNVVVVAAAGNITQDSSCSPQNTPGKRQVTAATPADQPGVLAVGAVDTNGDPASFSLVGTDVAVAAPGTDIISTNPYNGRGGGGGQVNTVVTQNGTGSIQGTSFAAPYVAGVAALVRGAHPTWTAKQVVQVIEQTAAHPAAPGGRNEYVGYGLVDPVAAVTALEPGTSTVRQKSNPVLLPAARTTQQSTRPKHVALYGSLIAGLVILAGAIAVQTRRTRRRRSHAALGTATRRELSGSR